MKIYKIKVNGKTYKVELEAMEEASSKKENKIETKAAVENVKKENKISSTTEGLEILSPIQGMLLDYKVKVGDKVKKGDILLLIEAMKLENEVRTPQDGVVSEIIAAKGSMVSTKQLLMKIK